MKSFNESICCCYLYVITKYGYPPPTDNICEQLEEMHRLGYQSVELEGIREEHLLGVYGQREKIKAKIDQLGIKVPYFCVVLPGLSSFDKEEREKNLTLFRLGCEIASYFDAKGVLDNAPLPPYQFPADIPIVRHYEEEVLHSATFPDDMIWSEYWDILINTYQRACDIASEYRLTYQMHPCAGVLSATTDAFLYFAQAVNRKNLRFNLDTANQFFLKDNLSLCLIRLAKYIDYIHVSDNRGHKVEHLVPGDGSINWDQFFDTLRRINFKGILGVDVGGHETKEVTDLDKAYTDSARWLEKRL